MSIQSARNPCCTISLCGQQKGSWRDLMMGTLELGGAAMSFVAFYIQENNTLGGGAAAATVLTAFVHWRWREDAQVAIRAEVAKLESVVSDIQSAEEELEQTMKKSDFVARRLTSQEEKIGEDVDDLTTIKDKIDKATEDLNEKVSSMQREERKLKRRSDKLEQTHRNVKEQITLLKKMIEEIKALLESFSALKSSSSDTVKDKLAEEERRLKDVLSEDNMDDVDKLAEIVTQSQKAVQDIFRLLTERIQALNQDTVKRKSQERAVASDDSTLRQMKTSAQSLFKKQQLELERITPRTPGKKAAPPEEKAD